MVTTYYVYNDFDTESIHVLKLFLLTAATGRGLAMPSGCVSSNPKRHASQSHSILSQSRSPLSLDVDISLFLHFDDLLRSIGLLKLRSLLLSPVSEQGSRLMLSACWFTALSVRPLDGRRTSFAVCSEGPEATRDTSQLSFIEPSITVLSRLAASKSNEHYHPELL